MSNRELLAAGGGGARLWKVQATGSVLANRTRLPPEATSPTGQPAGFLAAGGERGAVAYCERLGLAVDGVRLGLYGF